MKKKAQAISLGRAPQIVLLLALTAMIAAAAALALSSFEQTQCANSGGYWGGTACQISAVNTNSSGDYAVNATVGGLKGLDNMSTQLPTVGTVIGVALIIVVVIGAFAFFLGNRGPM